MLVGSEKKAFELVSKIGAIRATRILEAIDRRFNRRFRYASGKAMITPTATNQTELEINLKYLLKLGLMLTDTDTPEKAHQRVLARIAERNAERAKRKQSR
ncbi:hypothetical protein [Photobacterium leiognathi]|uniref:hypothetical protein n=1 Tax=Photobacterium leiognathi TaxID=553611 RepID=UPI002980BB50|nr:hypothetical protein [Photobacterium leiognathi]